MSALGVVGLVLGILAFNALLWIIALRWLRKRMAARLAQAREKLGPRPEIAAEPATYRGATRRFGKVKGLGIIGLTERGRLIFVHAVGKKVIELDRREVVGVREDKWFLRAYAGGRAHLILELRDGTEVGFFVRDNARWRTALGSSQGAGSV